MSSRAFFAVVILALTALFFLATPSQACTTLLVGKLASVDGSVMATHSNDGEANTDPRLVKIPARVWPKDSKRPVYPAPEEYPRYVGTSRQAKEYFPQPGQEISTPVGHISHDRTDRVLNDGSVHTYGYLEDTYGAINEAGLGMGESTCSARYGAKGIEAGGKAMMSVDELTKIAMERVSNARDAVQLMGDLAVEFGFHGQGDAFEGAGESLMVADADEGWVFHILADSTGTSAIWVAQRVPDDSMAVVANMYTIREVDLSNTDEFLGRQDMWELAKQGGLWDESKPKDWTATFSDGEYAHKYYSGRRMWGAWSMVAPEFTKQHISPEYGNLKLDKPYPFAVKVEKKLSLEDVFAIHRSWYEGTPYDLSAGVKGGFGGSPDRYSGCQGDDCKNVQGNWERAIGLFRTSDTTVAHLKRRSSPSASSAGAAAKSLMDVSPMLWYGPHAAHTTIFSPLSPRMVSTPLEYAQGWAGVHPSHARRSNSGYWASRFLNNLMQVRFKDMYPVMRARQLAWENKGLAAVLEWEKAELALLASITNATGDMQVHAFGEQYEQHMQRASETLARHARQAVNDWWFLGDDLMFSFSDGCFNKIDEKTNNLNVDPIGYPSWWLANKEVHFTDGPPPPKQAEMTTSAPSAPVAAEDDSIVISANDY